MVSVLSIILADPLIVKPLRLLIPVFGNVQEFFEKIIPTSFGTTKEESPSF
ncbi:hypothetical protein [Spiroplasma endosymbiont of Aspidapion aeneum]|uniref:hypothetical protein n=1 Tax=Spiroplasma endosymbiont of Aspidapion aeneum TaxID=3066276 RepID=UPI00313ED4BB